jgi:hypothetical protein
MNLLCICAESGGYLTINGIQLSGVDIAAAVGKSPAEVDGPLAELARWGVYSVDRRGIIFSRRLVRDEKKARTARENGKLGGNPSLRKPNGSGASDNHKRANGSSGHSTPIGARPGAPLVYGNTDRGIVSEPPVRGSPGSKIQEEPLGLSDGSEFE